MVPNVAGDSIGRITASGQVTYYSGTGIDGARGITAGPDGALWFANYGGNSIGRITTTGQVTTYTGTGINGPAGITAGPDGALWFTNQGNNSIGRITTSGQVTSYSSPSINGPAIIITGPDGALWFDNDNPSGAVGRITTAGQVTSYGSGLPYGNAIAAGPHGTVWTISYTGEIWKINTTTGHLTRYHGAGQNTYGIAAGPGGAMWFCDSTPTGSIGRITTSGKVTTLPRSRPRPGRNRGPGLAKPCGSPTTKPAGSGGSPYADPPTITSRRASSEPGTHGRGHPTQPGAPGHTTAGNHTSRPPPATPAWQGRKPGSHDHGRLSQRHGTPNPKRHVHAGRSRELTMITGLSYLVVGKCHDLEVKLRRDRRLVVGRVAIRRTVGRRPSLQVGVGGRGTVWRARGYRLAAAQPGYP